MPLPVPVGLERDGAVLLKGFCPPYYPNMTAAVRAFVDHKFGPQGVFRGGAAASDWRDPAGVAAQIPAPSEAAIQATIAYCEYVYQHYGRFPDTRRRSARCSATRPPTSTRNSTTASSAPTP